MALIIFAAKGVPITPLWKALKQRLTPAASAFCATRSVDLQPIPSVTVGACLIAGPNGFDRPMPFPPNEQPTEIMHRVRETLGRLNRQPAHPAKLLKIDVTGMLPYTAMLLEKAMAHAATAPALTLSFILVQRGWRIALFFSG